MAAKSLPIGPSTLPGLESLLRPYPMVAPSAEPLPHRIAHPTIAAAQLEIVLPSDTWLSQFTTRHPDLRVLIFNQLSLSRHRWLIGIELWGDEGVDYEAEIRDFRRVKRVERVACLGRPTRYLVEVRGSPFLLLLARLNLLFSYPINCQQGVYRIQLMDRVSKLRDFAAAIRQLGGEVRVTRMRRGQVRSSSAYLTATQARLFHKAVAVGYFDVPRRVTLEKLSRQVGLSISWVSTALATVEKKLADAAIADAPFPTARMALSTKRFSL